MNKRLIQYAILAAAIILLLYGAYFSMTYHYLEEEVKVNDSITLLSPISSNYTVDGDTIKFRDKSSDIYNIDITKTDSSDDRVIKLLNYFKHLKDGSFDYYNETCCLISVNYEDGSGFDYHAMLIPSDSINKENMSITGECDIWLFDGTNREFVLDSAFNSRVVL